MKSLESLYSDCVSYIGMQPVGMSSVEFLALYDFVEAFTGQNGILQRTIDAAQIVVDKYQKFKIEV